MVALGAGALHENIAFEARRADDDGFGNPTSGPFEQRFSCRASLVAKVGGEAVTAARLEGRQLYAMRVRDTLQTRQVTTAWRAVDLRDTTRIFNIRANVALTEFPGWRELLVEQGVAT